MKTDLVARKINPNDDHIQIAHWHVADRSSVKKGQDLLDVSTSKVTLTLQSEASGFIQLLKRAGQRVRTGEVYAHLYSSLAEMPETSAVAEKNTSVANQNLSQSFDFVRFSDAALALLQEHNLDQSLFAGMGLVTAGTVNQKVQNLQQENSPLLPKVFTSPYRTQTTFGPKELEIRQLTLGQAGLINSQLTVQFLAEPIFENLRAKGRDQMSLLPIVLFEFAQLLSTHPLFTAFYADGKIHFYDEVRLGLALDTGQGLKVVCFPKATELAPAQWNEKITELAMKDMRGQLAAEDLESTTVTVTDLSSLDVLNFHPLINGQQSCILGIGGDRSLPEYPMTLNLNFDHRVLTGREAGEFLNALKLKILSYRNL